MAEIRLQEGESIENALRRFKRKVQTEDIIKDVKRHSFYLKPGDKKRVKQLVHESVLGRNFAKKPTRPPIKGVAATELRYNPRREDCKSDD